MSRTNEAKNIKWHETCKCECRLDAIVCNDKQRWSKDKCRCECKEFIHKGVYVYVYYECECNKACDFSEYLDYKNCTCKKGLVDKLAEECNEIINEEVEMIDNNKNKCNSCIVYIVVFPIFFIINVGIDTYFASYKYMNRNNEIFVSKYCDYFYY